MLRYLIVALLVGGVFGSASTSAQEATGAVYLVRAHFSIAPEHPRPGDVLRLTTELRERGRPLSGADRDVRVTVRSLCSPGGSLGDILSPGDSGVPAGETAAPVHPLPTHPKLNADPGGSAPLLRRHRWTSIRNLPELSELRDDGTEGDEVAGDGVYTVLLRGINQVGQYCFLFRADGTAVTGEAFTRSVFRRVFVDVPIDVPAHMHPENRLLPAPRKIVPRSPPPLRTPVPTAKSDSAPGKTFP